MQLRRILFASILTTTLCSVAPMVAHAGVGIDINIAPPAPREVLVPPPREGYVWAPGYWRWRGHDHVWVDGRWMHARPHRHWVPEHWDNRHDRWHFERGHWDRD